MNERYERTQVGCVIIVIIAATMTAIGILLGTSGINGIAIAVLVILELILILFPSTTVRIWEEGMIVQLGLGVIGRQCRLRISKSVCLIYLKNQWR